VFEGNLEGLRIEVLNRFIMASSSPSVQSRDKDNLIAIFELVFPLPFKLPVGVVYEYQNAWSTLEPATSFNEQQAC